MGHLTREELVDIAEGTRAESSVPHLSSCEACRHHLTDLRAMLLVAAEVDVPEPSPLYWDHLSERVREAVAAEGAPRRTLWLGDWLPSRWALPLSAGAFAVVMLAAVLTLRLEGPVRSSLGMTSPAAVTAEADMGLWDVGSAFDEPSLGLVADLAADMDWEMANEAGLTTRVGGADNVLAQLSDPERLELQRLLNEELGRSGA